MKGFDDSIQKSNYNLKTQLKAEKSNQYENILISNVTIASNIIYTLKQRPN